MSQPNDRRGTLRRSALVFFFADTYQVCYLHSLSTLPTFGTGFDQYQTLNALLFAHRPKVAGVK